MAFCHTITVRFDEIDRAGIAYFNQAFRYCHITYEELLAQIVGNLEELLRTSTWGMPLVHAEADYVRPMLLGDVLTIELEVERLGEKSVTFAYRIRGADGAPRARVKLVHAFIARDGFSPIAAPPEFRAGLAALGLIDADG